MDGDEELRETEAAIAQPKRATPARSSANLHARYAALGGYDARSRAGTADARSRILRRGLKRDRSRAFSGGWRVRLNVAQALMCRSDLLLLDEPTNHLDLDAVIWLEDWLRDYPGTLLMIAHDREFLDRTVDRIVHIEQGDRAALHAATTPRSKSSAPRSSRNSSRCTSGSSARSST